MRNIRLTMLTLGLCLSAAGFLHADLFQKIRPHYYYTGPLYRPVMEEIRAERDNLDTLRNEKGEYLLHAFIRGDMANAATMMLIQGANPNVTDAQGFTPIFPAIDRGDEAMVKNLILKGALINVVAGDKTTPLTHAIARKNVVLVELLLWLGADIHPAGVPYEQQPLVLTQRMSNPQINQLLLDYDSQAQPTFTDSPKILPRFVQNELKNELQNAAQRADYERLLQLIQSGGDINAKDDDGYTALIRAIRAPRPEVVFYLLFLGANPNGSNEKDYTPLMQTMGWLGGGLDEMKCYLLIKGANPSAQAHGWNEFTFATEHGNGFGLTWLLWLGADPKQKSEHGTPLEIAFHGGSQGVIDLLRQWDVGDPLPPPKDPVWNLHNAARRGDEKLVLQFLGEGVPIDAADASGDSPLMAAIGHANMKLARVLIAKGANVNYQNPKSGWTPLFVSLLWNVPGVSEVRDDLFKKGANPNVQNSTGETPLMRATDDVPTQAFKLLVSHGADVNAKDNKGRSVLGRAIDGGHLLTAEYLKQHGANL